MNEHFVTLGGQQFFYRSWGDPSLPPLLMLHGFPEYSGAWEELATLLCDRFYCVAPDQRGYGQSWAPPEVSAYRTSVLAGDMAELITLLGGRVTVLGHDWGSAVAYALAMSRPEMVERLVILNGVHPVPYQAAIATGGPQCAAAQYILALRAEGSEDRFSADNFAKLLQLFSANMDLDWLGPERMAQYKAEWARPGRMRAMINWYRASPIHVGEPGVAVTDLPEFPRERLMVRMPHLLVWGEDDTALLPVSTEGLETYCDDLTRVNIKGADHWLAHQQPGEVAAAILNWAD